MPPTPLARVRKLCLSHPDTTELRSWGAPTFRVRGRVFAMYAAAGDHRDYAKPAVWLACTQTNQEFMIADRPKTCFKPPYVGPSGWVGLYLDGRVNWTMVAECVRDAYDMIAAKARPKRATKPAR